MAPGGSAAVAGRKICDLLSEPFVIEGREFRISGSCGLTMLAPGDCSITRALIRAVCGSLRNLWVSRRVKTARVVNPYAITSGVERGDIQ